MPKRISAKLKRLIVTRAAGCCEYCLSQESYSPVTFSIEHITPESRGGLTSEENLALSCQTCNNHKYTKITGTDPITQQVVALYHPRQHHWNDHFIWSEDYTLLLGISPIGRASIEVLALNRSSLVALRHVLQRAGKHPPPGLP